MKPTLTIALFLMAFASFAQNKPTHFKSELDFGNGTLFSTFFDVTVDQGQFTITSPKDADVRMFGSKAKLGRALGKSPKKGIIITISGQQKNDSLFGETKIPVFGKLKFRGMVNNQTLSGELLSNDTISIGSIHGVISADKKMDYNSLYPMMVKTIEDNIYSKDALQTKEWKGFLKDIEKLCDNAHDDIELFLGFNILSQKLPFSHLTLVISQDMADETDAAETAATDETTDTPQSVIFEEKNGTTAYLMVKNFSSSQKELAAILPKIVANPNYKNLIIDLRNNGGGGISPAFELAKYIVTDDMEVGYFPTNKLQYSGYQPELFRTLPAVQPKGTNEFGNELRTSPGVKLIFNKPENPVFSGNIYILTNDRTGSTCEPIVYAMKNSKKAIVVGEKTAGAMLAASPFDVSGKYLLMIPIADFYTYDGVRLDKVGVNPDVEVKQEEALNKALELINTGTN